MSTRAKALLYLANNLLFWAKTLLVRAKIIKVCRGRELLRDQISELPDEIIVCILSLLTMKEAGQTSVLSKRFRDVWSYIPVLNFDASEKLSNIWMDEKLLEVGKPLYLGWVNQVVSSYKGSTIDEFRIRFDISETNSLSIDNWVSFAMEKRVRKLELDLRGYDDEIQEQQRYIFPSLSICNLLTSLKLDSINITDEVLQNILKSCLGLEYLAVGGSGLLEDLKVTGDILSLKCLEIYFCKRMKNIQFSAPNLVSFRYDGPRLNGMPLKRTPKLAKLLVGSQYGDHVTNNFLEFSSYLIKLEELTLHLFGNVEMVMKSVNQFPECKNLKQLEVMIRPEEGEDLFCFYSLIKACPFLHKFILKLSCWNLTLEREPRIEEDCLHYHLKVLEIVGFFGNVIDLEFTTYLMKNCVALENIVINPRRPSDIGTPWEFKEFEADSTLRMTLARKQAEKLRENLKPGAELTIL